MVLLPPENTQPLHGNTAVARESCHRFESSDHEILTVLIATATPGLQDRIVDYLAAVDVPVQLLLVQGINEDFESGLARADLALIEDHYCAADAGLAPLIFEDHVMFPFCVLLTGDTPIAAVSSLARTKAVDYIPIRELSRAHLDRSLHFAASQREVRTRLRRHHELSRVISTISARFINLPSSQIDATLNDALGVIGRFSAVDRAFVFLVSEDQPTPLMSHEWHSPEITSAQEYYRNHAITADPWLRETLQRGDPIAIASPEHIPEQAPALQKLARERGVKSFVLVPIIYNQTLQGIIGAATLRAIRSWSRDDIMLYKISGEIFLGAMQRKRSEDALRASESRFSTMIESLGEGIILCDQDDVIIHVNSRMADLLGYTVDEMRGRRGYELMLPPEEAHLLQERTERRLKGFAERYEIRLQRKGGERFWAEINATPIYGSSNVPVGTLGAITDITEQKSAAEELSRQKDFLRKVIDVNPNLIFAKNLRGEFTIANHAIARLYHTTPEKMLGTHIREFARNPEDIERFLMEDRRVAESGSVLLIPEVHHIDAETKSERWFQIIKVPFQSIEGAECEVLGVATDITDRKRTEDENSRLQRQLLQAQKMEAIGQLAAGIAHDLNNSLAAVVGHLQLLKIDPHSRPSTVRSIDIALTGCERATALVGQLLGFSRQGTSNLTTVSIHDALRECSEFLSRAVGSAIRLEIQENERDLFVRADAGQLQQALANLIINAKQAMPQGGVISINAFSRMVRHPERRNVRAQSGSYIVLAVRDSGVGIPPNNLDKIFEPFFTTKGDSQGTGLGLSMVYGIMQHHGGWVEVESEVGRGSTFSLYFPRLERPQSAPSPAAGPMVQASSGMVLVIDDEASLVELARQFLQLAGFRAIGFTDGAAAMRWYADHWREVDLTILDMKMPRFDGTECFDEIMKHNPRAKVAILSGFIHNTDAQRLLERGALKFFHKPLRYPELVNWISEVIRGDFQS